MAVDHRFPGDSFVDAAVCARAQSTIERSFSAADLPRLAEAGAGAGSAINARLKFSQFDDRPLVGGELTGTVVLTCQRCMKAVAVAMQEEFQLLIVEQERDDEPGGYEPVIADAARLDLTWLTEEQVLLALPLVPMHEPGGCEAAQQQVSPPAADASGQHRPFANLRDMLRER